MKKIITFLILLLLIQVLLPLNINSVKAEAGWIPINNGLKSGSVTSIAVDPRNSSIIYPGTESSGLFKSTDSGLSWIAIDNGLTNKNILSLAIDPQAPAIIYAGSSEGGIFKYIDELTNEISFSINSSSSSGGLILPTGTITVNKGESKTFYITPYSGFKVLDVKVDGVSVGAVSSYTFNNITSNHTIEAICEKEAIVIILQIGSPYMSVNGFSQKIDPGRGTSPVIKNGRTLLPIRAIIEALGGTVEWEENTKAINIRFESSFIKLQIGNKLAYVNGEYKQLDPQNSNVKPEIINGRTMIPLRFVSENLGCAVDWDGTRNTITITYTGG